MRVTITLGIAFLASAAIAFPAQAQRVKNGGPSGTIVTAKVDVPTASTVDVLTTAPNEFFILTQYCDSGIMDLSSTSLGVFMQNQGGGGVCTTFEPGFAIPQGDTISCTNANSGITRPCIITGVQTRK